MGFYIDDDNNNDDDVVIHPFPQVCSYEQFIEEIGAMIQGVVLKHVEGSMTQRVQVRGDLP